MSDGLYRHSLGVVQDTGSNVGFLLAVWIQRLHFAGMKLGLAFAESATGAAIFTILSFLPCSYCPQRLFDVLREYWP